jgi:hypothetical protein
MKKIIVALAIMIGLGSSLNVSAQQKVRFYYYPSSNVYYNPVNGEYWYYDEPAVKWVEVKTLPSGIVIQKTAPRHIVYYNGPDVWRENANHKNKYKGKDVHMKKGHK